MPTDISQMETLPIAYTGIPPVFVFGTKIINTHVTN